MSDQFPGAPQPGVPQPGPPYGWTPPTYGEPYQAPYGEPYQAPYGEPYQPSYGQPYAWPPVATPPPERRSRTGLWVGLAIGGLVILIGIAVGAIALLAHAGERSGTTRTLSTPAQFASRPLLTDATAADVIARVKDSFLSSGSNGDKLLSNGLIGVYGPMDDTRPAAIFLGVSANDSSEAAHLLHGETDRAHTNEFLDGSSATGVTEYDPGPLGGSLKCGQLDADGAVCAWADYSTLGVVIFYDGTSAAQAAVDTVALRTAAER